jgi:hypothetical protein
MMKFLSLAFTIALSAPSVALAQYALPPPSTPAVAKASPATKPTVTVAVASVTLGDECSTDVTAPAVKRAPVAASDSAQSSAVAPGLSQMQICVQSALVLKVTSRSKSKQVIEIAKVELLDAQGKVLGTMTARNPMQWQTTKRSSSYQPWDLTLARGKSVQARWWLSAPPFKSPRDVSANAGGYRINVTLTVNGLETSASGAVNEVRVMSPPTVMEPGMVT